MNQKIWIIVGGLVAGYLIFNMMVPKPVSKEQAPTLPPTVQTDVAEGIPVDDPRVVPAELVTPKRKTKKPVVENTETSNTEAPEPTYEIRSTNSTLAI